MKRKFQVVLTLLLIIPGLMITASCAKKKVISGPGILEERGTIQRRTAPVDTGSQRDMSLTTQQKSIDEDALRRERELRESASREASYARTQFENEDIYFSFDSSALSPLAQEVLRRKAEFMRNNPSVHVKIEGHCDERGTNEYNMALGDRRARSTKDFLINLGISSSRISTISYGEEQPVDFNHNEIAWAKNRRGHFVMQ